MNKSPFLVYQDFLTPKLCEYVVDELDFYEPDYDTEGRPVKTIKHDERSEAVIYERFSEITSDINEYYNTEYMGMHHIMFEYYLPQAHNEIHCENSVYQKKTWTKVKHRDLTAILFMSEHQTSTAFDGDYEVYGGKLEFPQYDFSFNPTRGTLVIFPSGPWFLNATSVVGAGELVQARLQMTTTVPFVFDNADFTGTPSDWFSELS